MQAILTLNTGSSSVKFQLFAHSAALPLLAAGRITSLGSAPVFQTEATDAHPATRQTLTAGLTHAQAITTILGWLTDSSRSGGWNIACAVHRIVHGGTEFTEPTRLTPQVLARLDTLIPLAPLHQPHNLAGARILAQQQPELPQYACFDTAFHAGMQPLFASFALPHHLYAQGVRRYGFHGLSYAWVASQLETGFPHLAHSRVVVAHLGNGASLCAMKNGKSIDTSMGMTALDGLPMGTRCGAIDAGAVLYLQRTLGLSVDETENLLYNEAGLKGLSGQTNDVRTLLATNSPPAVFALQYFALHTAKYIASMAVSLGGIDAIIFTGGIGENSAEIRQMILDNLTFLPPFENHVIPTNEERAMAKFILKSKN